MLFPLVKKVDWSNPIRGVIQFISIGVLGVCFYFSGDLTSIGTNPVPQVVSASKLEMDVDSVLSARSLPEKEKVYKVFMGMADYCSNSDRTHKNVQLEQMVVEVIKTYKVENFTELDPLVQAKIKEAGLKGNETLVDSKSKASKVFSELGDAVKYSIEHDKNFKK